MGWCQTAVQGGMHIVQATPALAYGINFQIKVPRVFWPHHGVVVVVVSSVGAATS